MRRGSILKVASLGLLLALSGCHPFRWMAKIGGTCHDKKPYMTATSVPPLVIPPGLDPPDTGSALKIPQLNTPAPPPRKESDPCLDEPPSFVTAKPTPQA